MSVARCLEINARLRAAGITVHEYPGWESSGNGQTSAYEGGIPHHTAGDYAMALPTTGIGRMLRQGRSDLSGPLCNYATNMDGSMTIIAAHPANHAGASGGRSMGPLPTTTLFNKRVLGNEIVYPGFMPMTPEQYRTAGIWARIVADVVGFGNIERVRGHAETSITGKWDPGFAPGKTIDMAAFRAVAVIPQGQQANQQEDDVPSGVFKPAPDPAKPGHLNVSVDRFATSARFEVSSGWLQTLVSWKVYCLNISGTYTNGAEVPWKFGPERADHPNGFPVPAGTAALAIEYVTAPDNTDEVAWRLFENK